MTKYSKGLLELLVMSLTSVTLGSAIALLPTGISARLFLVIFAATSLLIFWQIRHERNIAFPRLHLWALTCLVTLSIVWPRYLFLHVPGMPSVNPLTLSAMAYLYIVLASILNVPQFSRSVGHAMSAHGALPKLILLALVWRLVCSVLGEIPVLSVAEFLKELVYVNSFILFGYVLSSFPSGGVLLFRALIACGVFVGFAGVVEAFTQHNWFVGFASAGADGDRHGVLANIAADKVREGAYRAQSTFDHPIVFAQFVGALAPIALYCLTHEKGWWRLLAGLSLPLALLAIVVSGSRSGFVSVVVGFGLFALIVWLRSMLHGRITKVIALVSLPVLIAGIGLGALLLQELAEGRGQHEVSSSKVRLQMLRNGVSILSESPIFGFGQGTAVYKAGVVNADNVATIDNYYLSIAVDGGYVGLALFVLVLVVFALKALKTAVMQPGTDGMFVGACVASVLSIAATFGGLSIINNMTLLWLLVGATAPYMARSKASRAQRAVA